MLSCMINNLLVMVARVMRHFSLNTSVAALNVSFMEYNSVLLGSKQIVILEKLRFKVFPILLVVMMKLQR